jgi:hypothetical protein
MKTFQCDSCGGPLFFENSLCAHCAVPVGYFPDRGVMKTLRGDGYKRCQNFEVENICNWMVAPDDPEPYCISCRLTQVIPDLSQPQNRELWYRTEIAKRRLIYSLLDLGLPVVSKAVDAKQGLAFQFRADAPGSTDPVLTGHDGGVITLNIAEADDAERERRRTTLHEPYRTLLGHFRHETGHYYWDLLLRDSERLQDFRRLFGDERVDYGQALHHHYEQGPAPDWQNNFVSSYASSHPWEDWAETWAHYLHMVDCLDTAAASGITLRTASRGGGAVVPLKAIAANEDFDNLTKSWNVLSCVLNNLNRSMGLQDAYPFVVPAPALAKLRFVHEVVSGYETDQRAPPEGHPLFPPVTRSPAAQVGAASPRSA